MNGINNRADAAATEPEGPPYTQAEVEAWEKAFGQEMNCPRCGNKFTEQRRGALTCDVCNHYAEIKPVARLDKSAPPAERAFCFVSGFCAGFAAGVLAAFYTGGRK